MGNITHLNTITKSIIGCGIEVHREHGPGLLESAYEACLAEELLKKGHKVVRQALCPLEHKGVILSKAYRIDLLVDDLVIVEIKTIEQFHPIHRAQILSYMYMMDIEIGLLINFKVPLLVDGVRRYRLWEAQRASQRVSQRAQRDQRTQRDTEGVTEDTVGSGGNDILVPKEMGAGEETTAGE